MLVFNIGQYRSIDWIWIAVATSIVGVYWNECVILLFLVWNVNIGIHGVDEIVIVNSVA
jgi:hypothetical protein